MKTLKITLLLAALAFILTATASAQTTFSAIDGHGNMVSPGGTLLIQPNGGTAYIYVDTTAPSVLNGLVNSFDPPPGCTFAVQIPAFPHSGYGTIHCTNGWVNVQNSPFPIKAYATYGGGATSIFYLSMQ